jgi:hypothetical protein
VKTSPYCVRINAFFGAEDAVVRIVSTLYNRFNTKETLVRNEMVSAEWIQVRHQMGIKGFVEI